VALGFFAHPDDAEILCAGTLARLRTLAWEVHIATATAGDCGTVDKSPWEISAIRTEEAKRAAAMIGATYHCLGELDGFVICDKPTLRKTIELFRKVAPSMVFTHPPQDYMLDHEESSKLARAVSFIYAAPNISTTPNVPGAGIPHVYCCDPIEGHDHRGRLVEPEVIVDISAQMPVKEKMLAAHASQRQWLAAHHGMDEYIEAMKRFGRERGGRIGVEYAEGFIQHRPHSFPQNDLLSELMGHG
jgi:LmbE family N-acetylglucosaminyl deacetylase